MNAAESHASEREKFATELVVQVSEPLKGVAGQYEDLRKCHVDFYGKLEKERDAAYGDLRKTKGKYDGVCQEVENRRKKMESVYDNSKAKAQAQYQQQIWDMNNVKVCGDISILSISGAELTREQNTYLININVTNKLKKKFFHEYIPELIDVSTI